MNRKRKSGFVVQSFTSVLACLVVLSGYVLYVGPVNVLAGEVNTQQDLPVAKEVQWDEETTEFVRNEKEFLQALTYYPIARIVLTKDIDLTSVEAKVRAHLLNRSLQIDGNGFTLKTTEGGPINDKPTFNLGELKYGKRATLHLKNLKVWTRGRKYIYHGNATGPRSEGWQVILDNVHFNEKQWGGNKELAVNIVVMSRGQVFLRNKVSMVSTNDALIVGELTVEPKAKVYSDVKGASSNWWFGHPNEGIRSVTNTINVGANADVVLKGAGNENAISGHWRTINIHNEAKIDVSRPGAAYVFQRTAGVREKQINVFAGATFTGSSNGLFMNELPAGDLVSHFYAAPTSIVKFVGGVNLANKGSSFELNQPAEYDIRTSDLGGRNPQAVKIGNDSQLRIKDSDIRVWAPTLGSKDLDGRPSMVWSGSTLIADGHGTMRGTNDPNDGTPSLNESWNTSKYARISGVNAQLVLAFDDLTDADNMYTVRTTIGGKPESWQGQVKLTVTNDRDGSMQYSTSNIDSKFEHKLPEGQFFQAGTTYTATGYRDTPSAPTVATGSVTVRDVTPPKPVEVDAPVYDKDKTITGKKGEPGAKISVSVNGEDVALLEPAVVQPDGKWQFTLSDKTILRAGDVLQVFLTDEHENKTPAETTTYRAATFEGATKITVEQSVEQLDLQVKPFVFYQKDQPVTEAQFIKDVVIVSDDKRQTRYETNLANVDWSTSGGYQITITRIDEQSGESVIKQTVVIVQ